MIWGEDNPFTDGIDFGKGLGGLYQTTYLPFDIAALQRGYGVNEEFALGDDLYTFNDDRVESGGLRTIWDNGGIDTIQYTGTLRSVINLNDATIQQEVGGGGFLSTSEALVTGYLIANGVTIENAIGGEEQDFITGNEVANTLTGNGGDDIIKAGDGNDLMIGGAGDDLMDGGADFDTAVLDGSRADYTREDIVLRAQARSKRSRPPPSPPARSRSRSPTTGPRSSKPPPASPSSPRPGCVSIRSRPANGSASSISATDRMTRTFSCFRLAVVTICDLPLRTSSRARCPAAEGY